MKPRQRRPGAILLVVMLVLMLCAALGSRIAMNVAHGKQVSRLRQGSLQADWLAESGARRAAARLAADPNYAGETWNIAAEALGGTSAAMVTIRVELPADNEPQRIVVIEAEYSAGELQRVRRTRDIKLQLIETGDES